MSWLLFMDESGHDHKNMPYEVRGGVALHASKLWPLIQDVRVLERSVFGCYLHEVGSEIKGSKLLQKKRLEWERQGQKFDAASRTKHALNFLNNTRQKRTPRRDEFTAFGQASTAIAEGIFQRRHQADVKVFASIIPHVKEPAATPAEFLRKDHVFLFERFFYFLQEKQETGLIVMDATDKHDDRRFVRRMERYFTQTSNGQARAQSIVPVPFFVESDMAYGVQIADVCIYCINWAYRAKGMNEPTRPEIEPFVWLLEKMFWTGNVYINGTQYDTASVVYVPDPYEARSAQEKRR